MRAMPVGASEATEACAHIGRDVRTPAPIAEFAAMARS